MNNRKKEIEQKQNSIIYVCKHCKETFWTWEEREEHILKCNVRGINNNK